MNQPKQLQAILKSLRASETKMLEGDHIGFGMLCFILFIYPLVEFIECNTMTFAVLIVCFGCGIVSYYLVYSFRARRSWYWEEFRRSTEGKDFREMWATCERGDWMLWFTAHMIGKPGWPTHQQVVLAACQCARLAVRHVTSELPIKAIETAELWARGEATIDQVRDARFETEHAEHSNAAYCAAQAACGAAWAVYAVEDGHSFRFAQAACQAASHAARAASSETFTSQLQVSDFSSLAHTISYQKEREVLCECAGIVRRMLTVPNTLSNELPLYKWVRRWDRNLNGKCTGRMNFIPVAVSRRSPDIRLNGNEINNANPNQVLRAISTLLALASACTLIGALGSNPAAYYTILRWVTCAAAVSLIWRGYTQGSLKWAYMLVPVVILFNPIIPVHLRGERWEVLRTWHTVDVAVAGLIVLIVIILEIQVLLAKKMG